MDIQERLTAFAMLGATWVMWLLVGISVIAQSAVNAEVAAKEALEASLLAQKLAGGGGGGGN